MSGNVSENARKERKFSIASQGKRETKIPEYLEDLWHETKMNDALMFWDRDKLSGSCLFNLERSSSRMCGPKAYQAHYYVDDQGKNRTLLAIQDCHCGWRRQEQRRDFFISSKKPTLPKLVDFFSPQTHANFVGSFMGRTILIIFSWLRIDLHLCTWC